MRLYLDLDGTLVDSQEGILASINFALASLGLPQEESVKLRFALGPPMRDIMSSLLAKYGDTRVDSAIELYRAHYKVDGILKCRAYKGISELLSLLRGLNVTSIVVTSKRNEFARRMVSRAFGLDSVAEIYGTPPDGSLDSKVLQLRHVLEETRDYGQSLAMVGDRREDVIAALENNVRSFGVLWGYGSAEELISAGVDTTFETPLDLSKALEGIATSKSA